MSLGQVEKTRAIVYIQDPTAPTQDFHGPNEDGLDAEVQLRIYRDKRLRRAINTQSELRRLAKLKYLVFDARGEHGGTLDTLA